MPDEPKNQTPRPDSSAVTRAPARTLSGRAVIGGFAVLVVAGMAILLWQTVGRGPQTAPAAPSTAGGARSDGAPRVPLPEKLDAILNSATTLQREQKTEEARAVLVSAVQQYPDEQQIRLALAGVLLEMQKPAECYEQYEKALAIGPRTATIEFAAGTVANMAGKPERAIEHYQQAQAADPANPEIPLFLAQVQVKVGQIDAAKASLLRAAKLDESRAMVWGTLADIALRENNANLARQHAAKARELEPRVTLWRLIEARALKRLARPQEAVDLLAGVPETERRDPAVLQVMGECYGLLSKPGEAAALYADAADAQPASAELALQAAEWLKRSGDAERAAAYEKRAAMLGTAGTGKK